MPDNQSVDNAAREKARHTATPAQTATQENAFAPELLASVTNLLGDPRLNGRGNQPVKTAVMQRMQRTSGNRATQRYLQRATPTNPSTRTQGHIHSRTTISIQAKAEGDTAYQPVQRDDAPAAAASGGATTNFNMQSTSYDISGSTLMEAYEEMSQHNEAGETSWNPKYNLTKDDSAKVTAVTIDVEITVQMPNWPNASKLGKDAKAEWDRFYQALDKHEQGHVDLVKTKFQAVAEKMLGKTEAEAAKEFKAALADLKKASKKFDTDTDHGRKEGTILDTSKDPPPKQAAPTP